MNSHNNSRKTSIPTFKSTKLLDQLREKICNLDFSLRTEEAYVYWVKKYIRFHQMRHPRELGEAEVVAYLSYLTRECKVSVSTHRQALSALPFLFVHLLIVNNSFDKKYVFRGQVKVLAIKTPAPGLHFILSGLSLVVTG